MERGSVIDAQLELQTQVLDLYQKRIGRVFIDVNKKDEFYKLWMNPSTYKIMGWKSRGPSFFIPAFEEMKKAVNEYGEFKSK